MTDKKQARPGLGIVFLAIVVMVLFVSAIFFRRAMEAAVVDRMYDNIEIETAGKSSEVQSGELSSLDASERLLELWGHINGEQLSCADLELALPTPLAWTGTTILPNIEDRRVVAVQSIITELQSLTGEDEGNQLDAWRTWLLGARAAGSSSPGGDTADPGATKK
jgi:hypothetical protein